MRKVIGIGETVLDIIFKNGQPVSAVPGGSAFNAIVSLGRAGVNTTFISEAGNDRVGRYVIDFLKDNGVNADHVNVFPDSKSPISLAFLDEHNNADYLFYKDHPHDQLEFVYPEVNPDDIVVFGSFFAVNPVVRPQVARSEEHTSELQSRQYLVCRLLLEKKKTTLYEDSYVSPALPRVKNVPRAVVPSCSPRR